MSQLKRIIEECYSGIGDYSKYLSDEIESTNQELNLELKVVDQIYSEIENM